MSKHIQVSEDNVLLRQIHNEIRNLNLKKDGRFYLILISKLVLFLGAAVFFYSRLYHLTSPGLFMLAFVAYGMSLILFAINFSHDLSHDALFKSRKHNNFFYSLIYTLVGAHAEAWKERHILSHHFAPNVQEYDSDLQITSLIRVTPGTKHLWFHRFQHGYAPLLYTTYSLYWIFIKDPFILFTKPREGGGKKGLAYHLSFWLQKLVYLSLTLILPLLFSQQNWIWVLLSFLLMYVVQSLFLLFTFFMTHHVEGMDYPATDSLGIIQSSWMMNQIKSSNDMHPFSFTANFILGGFNNHIAHHLFPHIHHIHYPKLNVMLYRLLREQNWEPNQTTYWGGIVSHLRWLKKMGKEQNASSVANSATQI